MPKPARATPEVQRVADERREVDGAARPRLRLAPVIVADASPRADDAAPVEPDAAPDDESAPAAERPRQTTEVAGERIERLPPTEVASEALATEAAPYQDDTDPPLLVHQPNSSMPGVLWNPVPDAGITGMSDETRVADDEPAAAEPPPTPDAPSPVADGGPDMVVWAGWDDFRLDARNSAGAGLSYEWRQVGGPTALELEDPRRPNTRVRGLALGEQSRWSPTLYAFELTVEDEYGRTATDRVEIVALTAPDLKIEPRPSRHFESRDGYWLGTFESRADAQGADAVLFLVRHAMPLTFTQVSGSAADVYPVGERDDHAYELTVYRSPDDASSTFEFLIDSDEQVPAIVRLIVRWE